MRILYYTVGQGSGPIYRGLALYKAAKRAGVLAQPQDFVFVVASQWEWLLPHLASGTRAFTRQVSTVVGGAALLGQTLDALAVQGCLPDLVVVNSEPSSVDGELKRYQTIPAWLVLRDFPDLPARLTHFDPARWSGVIGIEPGVGEAVRSVLTGQEGMELTTAEGLVHEVGPVISTWPDELLPVEEARTALARMAGRAAIGPGRPIALVAHNGTSPATEMQILLTHSRAGGSLAGYETLVFSQDGRAAGFILAEPIARYLLAVNRLVAVPSYNTFWEWATLAPFERVLTGSGDTDEQPAACWLEMGNRNDPQLKRTTILASPARLQAIRSGPRGADELIRLITARWR